MKVSSGAKNTAYLSIIILTLSLITIFLIIEFRFLKGFLGEYENNIQQIALNKVELFVKDVINTSENAARKFSRQTADTRVLLEEIAQQDDRITNITFLNTDGIVLDSLIQEDDYDFKTDPVYQKALTGKTFVSGVQKEYISGNTVVTSGIPVYLTRELTGILIINFRIDKFQKELAGEFLNDNYKVALFDNNKTPIFWPFALEALDKYKFNNRYLNFDVYKTSISGTSWQMHFFTKQTNLDTYRIITLMFLLFTLYFCVYQYIVELWNSKSLNSYFENIDFTILNHLKEGIIICNKFNKVTFANKAAHDIFRRKKHVLKGTNLKNLLEHIDDSKFSENKKITIKESDKLLEIAHSPIFKNGKMLGSFIVIGLSIEKEKTQAHVFEKLVELLQDGILFVDKHQEINTANLMAKYYLGRLEKGTNINEANAELASVIYNNIGSHTLTRTELPEHNLMCETIAIYDADGLYAGTLVLLKNNTTASQS